MFLIYNFLPADFVGLFEKFRICFFNTAPGSARVPYFIVREPFANKQTERANYVGDQ